MRMATHTGNAGFALVGGMTRTGKVDDRVDMVGGGRGSPPSGEGEK